jgi:hypothetical protein
MAEGMSPRPPRHRPPAFPHVIGLAVAQMLALASTAAEGGPLRLEGEVRMGLVRDGGAHGAPRDGDPAPRWRFEREQTLRLRAEGMTDGGLGFGAVLELDSDDSNPRRRR